MKTLSNPVKPKIVSCVDMEIAISRKFGIRNNIIVPNVSWGFSWMHECDLFLIKKSGYAVEIEIKRSVSDLKADFKKGHNHVDKKHRICEMYYAIPVELLEKCEPLIPVDAGIITVNPINTRYYATIHRKAIKIKNCRKLTTEEQLAVARLGTLRMWNSKEKAMNLEKEILYLKNKLKDYEAKV